jgi:hypothetical protein
MLDWPAFLAGFGGIAWVIGYDTLYAIQDIGGTDALVGGEVIPRERRGRPRSPPDRIAIFLRENRDPALGRLRNLGRSGPTWLALMRASFGRGGVHLASQVVARLIPRRGGGGERRRASPCSEANRDDGFPQFFLGKLVVGLSSR